MAMNIYYRYLSYFIRKRYYKVYNFSIIFHKHVFVTYYRSKLRYLTLIFYLQRILRQHPKDLYGHD